MKNLYPTTRVWLNDSIRPHYLILEKLTPNWHPHWLVDYI